MQINTGNLASITEANQNFSRIARMVDENGLAVIMKNNSPRYVLIDYKQFERIEHSQNEHVDDIAKRILAKNIDAFKELAK